MGTQAVGDAVVSPAVEEKVSAGGRNLNKNRVAYGGDIYASPSPRRIHL